MKCAKLLRENVIKGRAEKLGWTEPIMKLETSEVWRDLRTGPGYWFHPFFLKWSGCGYRKTKKRKRMMWHGDEFDDRCSMKPEEIGHHTISSSSCRGKFFLKVAGGFFCLFCSYPCNSCFLIQRRIRKEQSRLHTLWLDNGEGNGLKMSISRDVWDLQEFNWESKAKKES